MAAFMFTQQARSRLLGKTVAIIYRAVTTARLSLMSPFFRKFVAAFSFRQLTPQVNRMTQYFAFFLSRFNVSRYLHTTDASKIQRSHRSVTLRLVSLSHFMTLIYLSLCAAFSSVRIEPAAKRKPNSIATLKGNFYETYSRCWRRGGGS
jgi:hypothetical protein